MCVSYNKLVWWDLQVSLELVSCINLAIFGIDKKSTCLSSKALFYMHVSSYNSNRYLQECSLNNVLLSMIILNNNRDAHCVYIPFISFQIFVTRYLFWVSIFLVFFAAISRVSFFGFLYLLVCFALLYRGQNMLMDQKNKRIKRYQKCVVSVYY